MINPDNLESLASNLEDILETPVSPKLLRFTTSKERAFLASLIYKWSISQKVEGKDPEAIIREILDRAKSNSPKKTLSPATEAYLKIKKII